MSAESLRQAGLLRPSPVTSRERRVIECTHDTPQLHCRYTHVSVSSVSMLHVACLWLRFSLYARAHAWHL